MGKLIYNLFKTARPRQWLKNLSLAAPLVFSGKLIYPTSIYQTVKAIFIFCILSSSTYFLNDIIDAPRDKLHPFKKYRSIASGNLSPYTAFFVAIIGILFSLILASHISAFFSFTCLAYLTLQIIYSLYLKKQPILDVISIAVGFILRVYAGAFAIDTHISVWFLLCIVSLALFLAVGKRKSELKILDSQQALMHRKTLMHYPQDLLDSYLSMFAQSSWFSYALFTFFESPPVPHKLIKWLTKLPLTLSGTNKPLMITIPIVIFGIMRYMHIIHQSSRAESPERVLLSDKPLLATVLVWGIIVFATIYLLPT